MDENLRRQVWERAGDRCEYCHLPQSLSVSPFQIDHIIAVKHHGAALLENLALSCFYCNSFKGSNLAGFDLETRSVVRLFHPRQDNWHEHFYWQGALLLAHTAIGRVTIDVLDINTPLRLEHRQLLVNVGLLVFG